MVTVTVRSFESIMGLIFGTGDTSRFSMMLSICTNSSNSITMRLPAKFLDESAGRTSTMRGGNESRGPPEGGTILAQPVCKRVGGTKAISKIKDDTIFNNETCFIRAQT